MASLYRSFAGLQGGEASVPNPLNEEQVQAKINEAKDAENLRKRQKKTQSQQSVLGASKMRETLVTGQLGVQGEPQQANKTLLGA